MTMQQNSKTAIASEFEALEQSLNGSAKSVLHRKRKEAANAFEVAGFPHKKHEEYRYLNLSEVKNTDFKIPTQPDFNSVQASDYAVPNLNANQLVFIDGYYSAQQSNIIDQDDFTITSLNEAQEEVLTNHFGEYNFAKYNPFSALNIAFALQGVFIQIHKNTVVEHPIQIIHINTGKEWVQPHHLIVVEENAQVKLIESYFCSSESGLDNTFLRIIAKKSSLVEHYKLQALGENANHIGTTHIQQYGKSVSKSYVFNLSGGLVRNNIRIDIEEENTEANMYGIYVPNGKEVVDNHTLVNHKVSNCVSNQLYKGVVNGQSKAIFNGKIYVQRDAQHTNAFQSNRNIQNSDNATINTKPQLEIWADDVKCSHGATIGKLNQDELFYLQSRGIEREKAKSMLTYAFVGEIFTYITIPELRKFVEEGVAMKLGFEIG